MTVAPQPTPDPVPVNIPLLSGNEERYLRQCLQTGWISSEGPFVARFETELAMRVGREHGIACSSGSAALDIAVAAAGIEAGDEVILPTFTIISPAASIVRAGGTPVLVDSDPVTWNMDVSQIEAKITPRTKAIVVVHIYGLPADMQPVLDLAERHGLMVIEDAAEMHGQTYREQPCGSFGDMSIFSFYPNKHITTGEGGMVLTGDPALAERCRSLRNLCFRPGRRFVHDELGWNYRMTNLQAALGCAQLEKLDQHIRRKREIGALYNQLLAGHRCLHLPPASTPDADNIYWVYGIELTPQCTLSVDDVTGQLGHMGIGTRPFFWPMHEQPVFLRMGLFANESYPHAERMARRGFYLPSGLGLKDEQVVQSANSLLTVLENASK